MTSTDEIDWNKYFYYDETSPSCLRWRKTISNKIVCGAPAGCVSNGYWVVQFERQQYKIHRVVWWLHLMHINDGEFIDHINGNKLDNKLSNLRIVDGSGNQRNRKINSNNTSGVVGVSFNRSTKTWNARWYDLSKKKRYISFSARKYGYDEAFRLACEYRAKMIEELNRQGAGYTERHGT